MTEAEKQAARDRIEALLPDGFSVLISLRQRRIASDSEWRELRDWYGERVEQWYERFQEAWDTVLSEAERYRVLRKGGYCHRTSSEVSILAWEALSPSVKRAVWRLLPKPCPDG